MLNKDIAIIVYMTIPTDETIGIKEVIGMNLENYGVIHGVDIKELKRKEPIQEKINEV